MMVNFVKVDGLNGATRAVLIEIRQLLTKEAIHKAKTIEDLKPILLDLLLNN